MSITDFYVRTRQEWIDYLHSVWHLDEDAEDIVQDVFLRLLLLDRAESVQNVGSYIYRAIQNAVTDRQRKKHEERMPEYNISAEEEPLLTDLSCLLPDNAPLPDECLERQQLQYRIHDAIMSLPKEQRDVFIATEIKGIPFRTLAEQTQIPINTLLSRKHYAVLRLRQTLQHA